MVTLLGAAAGAVSLFTDWTLPPAAVSALIALGAVTLQSLLLTAFFVFLIAHRRATPGFLLPRDAAHFILGVSYTDEPSSLERLAAALHSSSTSATPSQAPAPGEVRR